MFRFLIPAKLLLTVHRCLSRCSYIAHPSVFFFIISIIYSTVSNYIYICCMVSSICTAVMSRTSIFKRSCLHSHNSHSFICGLPCSKVHTIVFIFFPHPLSKRLTLLHTTSGLEHSHTWTNSTLAHHHCSVTPARICPGPQTTTRTNTLLLTIRQRKKILNFLSILSANFEYWTRTDWSFLFQEFFFLTKIEMNQRGFDPAVRLWEQLIYIPAWHSKNTTLLQYCDRSRFIT